MLTVTESAKRHLREILLGHAEDVEFGLRLVPQAPGRYSLVVDREAPGDQVVEHEGSKVLLVASELAPVVEEVTLDVQDTPDGPKLVVFRE